MASTIKVNSAEYRNWIKYRNEKELIRRTKKRKAIRSKRTQEIKYNTSLKQAPNFNTETKHVEFKAPLNFSFIDNPESTINFFNEVIAFITSKRNFGKRLYIDISKIENLTIDALMYLLAIVNNLNNNFQGRFLFSGNAPANPKIRKLFNESGFYSFVKRIGKEPITKNSDTLQIVSGRNSDDGVAKRMSDFFVEKTGMNKINCRFLYAMMVELMSNTFKHAYNDDKLLYPRWYCFAEYKKEENLIAFTFMDTGEGIPSTVRKNFAERLDILKIKSESNYVISALNGEFRTSTGKTYRGKGLPRIREYCSCGKIKDMRIITNRANISVFEQSYSAIELHSPLRGTLYYWTIELPS